MKTGGVGRQIPVVQGSWCSFSEVIVGVEVQVFVPLKLIVEVVKQFSSVSVHQLH